LHIPETKIFPSSTPESLTEGFFDNSLSTADQKVFRTDINFWRILEPVLLPESAML
jgi:hypothetical protein